MRRRPRLVPESLAIGATPTSAAIWRWLSRPSSGSSAMRVALAKSSRRLVHAHSVEPGRVTVRASGRPAQQPCALYSVTGSNTPAARAFFENTNSTYRGCSSWSFRSSSPARTRRVEWLGHTVRIFADASSTRPWAGCRLGRPPSDSTSARRRRSSGYGAFGKAGNSSPADRASPGACGSIPMRTICSACLSKPPT